MDANKRTENLIKFGQVSSVDPARHTVRVAIADWDGMESFDLPVMTNGTVNPRIYHMPRVGEYALCAFLPNGMEQGFVLGYFYNAANPPGETDSEKWVAEFENGTRFEHDQDGNVSVTVPAGKLTAIVEKDVMIHSKGAVTINSETSITMTAPVININ